MRGRPIPLLKIPGWLFVVAAVWWALSDEWRQYQYQRATRSRL